MDFFKKFYLVNISKSSSKKSFLNHKRSVLPSNTNSNDNLLSDYSDDEQTPVMTYRQRSNLKKAKKKPQFEKKESLDTLYFDQKHCDDQLLHLTSKVQKNSNYDVNTDSDNNSKLLVATINRISQKNNVCIYL